MTMSEEVSEAEVEAEADADDEDCGVVEYEQELYSAVNFSSQDGEGGVNVRSNCHAYSFSKKSKVSRLASVKKVVDSQFVIKIAEFSKESVRDFIPLSKSTQFRQRRCKTNKHHPFSFRNGSSKKQANPYNKQNLRAMERESAVDSAVARGDEPRNETPEVIVLSDSDDCEVTVDGTGCDSDVLSISCGDDVLDLMQDADTSHKESTVARDQATPGTSGSCAEGRDASAADTSVVACVDSDRGRASISSEHDESDIEILPTPVKPSPLIVTLDSEDDISCEQNSEMQLANVDVDDSVVVEEDDDVPVVVSSVATSGFKTNSAVGSCWTPAMIKFYNESSGGEDFDHRILQKGMSRDPGRWRVSQEDILPPVMSKRLRQLRCSNCNQRGHLALRCTEPQRIKVCSLCASPDHSYTRCPTRMCCRCGAYYFGYNKSGCPTCIGHDIHCNSCNSTEHVNFLCPEVWRCYHHTTQTVLNDLSAHPAENLKHVYEQCCPNCASWGHKYEECMGVNWLASTNQQRTFSSANQGSTNGWSRHGRPTWSRPPHHRIAFHNWPTARHNGHTANQPRKVYYTENLKDAKIKRIKKLMKKKRKKERLAAKHNTTPNGTLVPQ